MEIDSTIQEVTKEDLHDRNEIEIITKEDAEKASQLLESIENFIDTNKDASSLDEKEKAKLYGEAKELWKELSSHINNIGFVFNLNDDEYKLLKKFILGTCNYDHQTVFMGVQLKEDFLKRAEAHRKEGKPVLVTCSETILIHHLFTTGGFTVKGLDARAYDFRNIMTAIGDINKIYGELDTSSKRAGDDINNWVQGLGDDESTASSEEGNTAEEA